MSIHEHFVNVRGRVMNASEMFHERPRTPVKHIAKTAVVATKQTCSGSIEHPKTTKVTKKTLVVDHTVICPRRCGRVRVKSFIHPYVAVNPFELTSAGGHFCRAQHTVRG